MHKPGGIPRRAVLRGGVAVAALLAATACQDQPPGQLRLAAGESGGIFWEFSGLLAAAAQRAGATRIVPLPSAGSAENLQALRAGRAELAMSLSDTAFEALSHSADGEPQLTAVGCVYENYFQVAVRSDAPIDSIADLRGRTVSVGAPGSGAAELSARVLDVAGLAHTGAMQRVRQPMAEAITALVAGDVDAVMWAGGLPTPAFVDLPVDIRLLDLAGVVSELRRQFGTAYEPVSIPANTYGRHPVVTTVGVPNLLLARSDVADDAIAGIVDLLIDDAAELVPAQAVGSQFLDAQSLIMTGEVPLHPGAQREYRARHG